MLKLIQLYLCVDDLAGDEEDYGSSSSSNEESNTNYVYQLIGVTVHTGTADGGHYYSFIRDRLTQNARGQDKWYIGIGFAFIIVDEFCIIM